VRKEVKKKDAGEKKIKVRGKKSTAKLKWKETAMTVLVEFKCFML